MFLAKKSALFSSRISLILKLPTPLSRVKEGKASVFNRSDQNGTVFSSRWDEKAVLTYSLDLLIAAYRQPTLYCGRSLENAADKWTLLPPPFQLLHYVVKLK